MPNTIRVVFNNDSAPTGVEVSQSPTYPTQTVPNINTKL